MANPIGQKDDVVGATDKLMKTLLAKAEADPDNVDFGIQCMQAATRWVAVKNRMSLPEEGNAFDGWRNSISDAAGPRRGLAPSSEAGAPAASSERATPGTKKGRATIGSSRLVGPVRSSSGIDRTEVDPDLYCSG